MISCCEGLRCWLNQLRCIRLSFLPARIRSFRPSLGCFVLVLLHVPLCYFRLHSASHLLYNPPSAVFCVLFSRRLLEQSDAPWTSRCSSADAPELPGSSCAAWSPRTTWSSTWCWVATDSAPHQRLVTRGRAQLRRALAVSKKALYS